MTAIPQLHQAALMVVSGTAQLAAVATAPILRCFKRTIAQTTTITLVDLLIAVPVALVAVVVVLVLQVVAAEVRVVPVPVEILLAKVVETVALEDLRISQALHCFTLAAVVAVLMDHHSVTVHPCHSERLAWVALASVALAAQKITL